MICSAIVRREAGASVEYVTVAGSRHWSEISTLVTEDEELSIVVVFWGT